MLPSKLQAIDAVPPNQIAVTPPVSKELTRDELVKKTYQYAEKYGVSGDYLVKIINCEDRDWNPKLQSGLTYKEGNRWGFPAGTKEKSYGLAQIHLPDHKAITYEQATNPDFALDYLAKNIAGGTDHWSCQ